MRICSRIVVLAVIVFFISATTQAFSPANVQSKKSVPKRKRAKADATDADSQAVQSYQVKLGDSLYTIARDHGTSVAALKSFNQLHTNRLKIGQSLRLPSSRSAGAAVAGVPDSSHARQQAETTEPALAATGESTAEMDVPEVSAAPVVPGTPVATSSEQQNDPNSDIASQPLRVRLASMGTELLGVRYRWSGNSEVSGFDCSGLVKSLFDKFNISLPRTSREQYQVGEKVDKDKLEIGDLVFFSSRRNKTPSHVGIYIGDNQFLHAARKARRVIISSLSSSWYMKRFLGARRLADLWAEEPPGNSF